LLRRFAGNASGAAFEKMAKLTLYRCGHLLFVFLLSLVYQTGLAQYRLKIIPVDIDSTEMSRQVKLQDNFKNRQSCEQYINNLQALLQSKGFASSSIDSIYQDSSAAAIQVYFGKRFKIGQINTMALDNRLLSESGWTAANLEGKPLTLEKLQQLQASMLYYLENNGYPFARLQFDSIYFIDDAFYAKLLLEKGPLYKIDSIRVYGDVKISNTFLQHYLEISNGSIYRKEKLQDVSRKLLELPYLEEKQAWNLTMLGTGSILNLYLKPKKSSQVNVLVGFLPSNEQTINNKILITGEANINLRNALGSGETIGLNWQQIQLKSPRLNILYQQPYIFKSNFGISSSFDLLKKDSSYLNLNLILGVQYMVSAKKSGRVFVQNLKTNVLTIDTAKVKASKQLPPEIDVSSLNLGVDYDYNNTNFRFNPKSGSDLKFSVAAGSRNIRKSSVIMNLYSPNFDYGSLYDSLELKSYQLRTVLAVAHYFPVGRQSTFKVAANTGWFISPSIFRNELFQIGGYKLLRGFDEESIFASQYVVGTAEYRYLIGLNSYLFSFIDLGWAADKSSQAKTSNKYFGAGAGMAFETKAGIFNISYAAGKRDDTNFNLRQSKIHLGYINFF